MHGRPQNSVYLRLTVTSFVLLFGGSACNTASIPDTPHFDAHSPSPLDAQPIDSSPGDACNCSSVSNLAARIGYIESQRPLPISAALHGQCLDEDLTRIGTLLGGSYALAPSSAETDFVVSYLGVRLQDLPDINDPNINHSWGASIRSSSPDTEDMHIRVACLLDEQADASEPECARSYQVTHEVTYAWIPPSGVVDASALCENGLLISGSCTTDFASDSYTRLIRGGMSLTDRNRWQCSWRSHDEEAERPVAAHAFCLEEQLPEGCECCPPFADAIEVRQSVQPLVAGTNRLQVSCEPGELLLLGNCMLDGADSAELADVTMLRFGFPPSVDNVWGCSWNNPGAVEANGRATTLCFGF